MSGAVATRNGLSLSTALDLDTITGTAGSSLQVNAAPLGTRDYTILLYCPILSHLTCAGAWPVPGVLFNKQVSGFVAMQTSSLTTQMDIGAFFGHIMNAAGTSQISFENASLMSMTEL